MIRVILTDIEGTTSSLDFVHNVLFPYSATHMAGFVREGVEKSPEIREQLDAVAQSSGVPADDTEGLIGVLESWIGEDRKETPLKALQGMLWEQGYRRGAFRGHVYEDAAEYLQRWHDRGLRLFVYSSGSVKAQKLIFGYSEAGDLTLFFSGYFDTRIGAKTETGSYRNIIAELGVDAGTVLFLSDREEELIAAENAGMETFWLIREGDIPQTDRRVARDFADVDRFLLRR